MKEPSPARTHSSQTFAALDRALELEGPLAAVGLVIDQLEQAGEHRALLDALLLKARLELALPLIPSGTFHDLHEPERSRFEDRYVQAIHRVGERCLELGDIPTGWTYLRTIGEDERVGRAIREYQPDDDDERAGAIIEVAFHHGVEPARGFELLLERFGTCSAISAFEQAAPRDDAVRAACVERLIERVHRDLVASLRADLASRGQVEPPAGASVAELIAGRDWLFSDDSYHIDVSHLAAVVRFSVIVKRAQTLALAVDLTEYGRRLSPRLKYESPPPFQDTYGDHHAYLGALIGRDVEGAVHRFKAKLAELDPGEDEAIFSAQTLVNLLSRVGRGSEAVEVAVANLAGLPETALFCPNLAQLCEQAAMLDRLGEVARARGDLVSYATARLAMGPIGHPDPGSHPAV